MESSQKSFDIVDSKIRLNEILNESDASFPETNEVAARDKLTYTNGYYVNCCSVFVDIRGSSKLTEKYKRPTLAKIYRCFISEMAAVACNCDCIREVNIQGDCVWSVYNTPYKSDIDKVFVAMAQMKTILKLINKRLSIKDIEEINIGIGASYGRALQIMAGYKGSGLKDIIYMGDVVNEASKLCSMADTSGYMPKSHVVSEVFYNNLNDEHKKLFTRELKSGTYNEYVYYGNAVIGAWEKWIDEKG